MGGKFRGKMDTCICMAKSHCCSAETITTLGYAPKQNKKYFKNRLIKNANMWVLSQRS